MNLCLCIYVIGVIIAYELQYVNLLNPNIKSFKIKEILFMIFNSLLSWVYVIYKFMKYIN